jgi:hypothetical protein
MESSRIYRELSLSLDKQIDLIEDILLGKSTISCVAEIVGQDDVFSFDADGDILIICGHEQQPLLLQKQTLFKNNKSLISKNNKQSSPECMVAVDEVFRQRLIPAIMNTQQPIELVVKHCGLSLETICLLADAIRENTSLVGFNIEERNEDEVAMAVLKHACINTLAPIKWYQGEPVPENISEAREKLERQRKLETIPSTPRPSTPATTNTNNPKPISGSSQPKKVQFVDLPQAQDENKSSSKKLKPTFLKAKDSVIYWNEREIWTYQMKEQLKSLHKAEELDQILSSLELYELQMRIDHILSERGENSDSFSRWSLNGSTKGKYMIHHPHLV